MIIKIRPKALGRCKITSSLQDYEEAIENQNFEEAARLRDEGMVGLRGWWCLHSSSAQNPSHLLRIRQAFDRYVLLAYSPADIASIHVSHPCNPSESMFW